jgi:hypothetical protein
LHPDVEIIVRQRKISATRTEPEPVRASRAQIERGMTNGMKQAEREIAQRWLIRTGFLGIKTSEVDPITGGISERDLDTEHLYVRRTLKCSTPATARPAPSSLPWPQTGRRCTRPRLRIFAANRLSGGAGTGVWRFTAS